MNFKQQHAGVQKTSKSQIVLKNEDYEDELVLVKVDPDLIILAFGGIVFKIAVIFE